MIARKKGNTVERGNIAKHNFIVDISGDERPSMIWRGDGDESPSDPFRAAYYYHMASSV